MGLAVFDGKTARPVPVVGDLVPGAVTALGLSPKGEIWFVTAHSFGVIDPERLHAPMIAPLTEISRIEVDEEPVDPSSVLEFPFDRNNCTFTFRSVSLQNTQDIRYQYRLVGVDRDWLPPSALRSVTYASLEPGTYRFEVRASRLASTDYGETALVSFSITPPIWDRWWARISAALCVIGLIASAYRRRIAVLQRERQAEKEFSERLLASQEEERSRIAGELHDSLVQNLLIAKNRSLIGLDKTKQDEAHKEFSEISSVISDAIQEVREIAHNLRPYQLDRIGLTRAIQALLEKINESLPITMTIAVDDIDRFFTPEKGIHLYRIVQEGINNIIKHSGATEGNVCVKATDHAVSLSMSDNGRGLPAQKGQTGQAGVSTDRTDGKGFGVSGIEQRVRMLGGVYSLVTNPKGGTTLHVTIPIDGERSRA
jgi:signal transduction histidine kinase